MLTSFRKTIAERLADGNPRPVRATISLKAHPVQVLAVSADNSQVRVKWPDGTDEVLTIGEIDSIE